MKSRAILLVWASVVALVPAFVQRTTSSERKCIDSLSMNVLVAGSTGRVGQRIVKQLSESSYDGTVRCLARATSVQKAQAMFEGMKDVEVKAIDYDKESVRADLVASMAGCTTVICALGALETDALNWKQPYKIDGKLSQEMIDAAVASPSVKNFILVSSLGTDRIGFPASVLNLFWGILSWKRQTEVKLINSGLNFFIVRPGGMEKPTDDFDQTHNMKLHLPSTTFGGLISRKQIASLCVASILNPELIKDRIVEVTADPSYQKLSAQDLLAALPEVVDESIWRAKLTADEFYVLREAGTERPWTSPLNEEKRKGVFECAGCGTPLFPASSKFESGTGWPSFSSAIEKGAVVERSDFMFGITRTEVLCSNCGGHLGHVFPDGPRPTGLRYCMNGVSLKFVPDVIKNSVEQSSKIASRLDDSN
jgi:peptide-methionine (R)-S-oxide reductase